MTTITITNTTQLHARWEGGVREKKLPRAPWCLGGGADNARKKIRYSKMRHFKQKSSNIFSPDEPCEYVSSSPAVALDGPAVN